MDEMLIAPCGFNCQVCAQYQKRKNPCVGCRTRTTRKSQICIIKNCDRAREQTPQLCIGCAIFPCRRLQAFDQRYQKISDGYLSVIENLKTIEKLGMTAFLKREESKWTCPHCGSLSCSFRGRIRDAKIPCP